MKNEMQWEKLTQLARQTQRAESTDAPHGFALRVMAQWQATEPITMATVWEFLSLRSLAFAAILMVASVSINFDLLSADWNQEMAMNDAAMQDVLEP